MGLGKRLPAVALALLLSGCIAAGRAPPPPPYIVTTAPQLTDQAFIAADGARLPLRAWLPEGQVKAVVLALHGFNDYSNSFANAGTAWAADGIATYAYDQRGFGLAPLRGGWAGTYALDEDLATASRMLRARYPGVPLYLLGESMGGAVIATALAGVAGAEKPVADGVILAAPAIWGRRTMNVFERVALSVGSLFPNITFTGQGLHVQASDNIPMLRALGRDPLVIKDTKVEAIRGLVNLMDAAYDAAPRIETPLLLLYGDHDELISRGPMRRWIAHLPTDPKGKRVVAWYVDGYHMLTRDIEGPVVLRDIASWVLDRAAPLPSGADHHARSVLARAH